MFLLIKTVLILILITNQRVQTQSNVKIYSIKQKIVIDALIIIIKDQRNRIKQVIIKLNEKKEFEKNMIERVDYLTNSLNFTKQPKKVIPTVFSTKVNFTLEKKHTKKIIRLVTLPDGKLASASADNSIMIWNVSSEKNSFVTESKGNYGKLVALDVLKNGQLVSGWKDTWLRIWDLIKMGNSSNLVNNKTRKFNYPITCLAVLRNQSIVIGFIDGEIVIWNHEDNKSVIHNYHSSAVTALAAFKDGRFVSADQENKLTIWSDTKRLIRSAANGHITSLIVLNDNLIATSSKDNKVIKFWDTKSNDNFSNINIMTTITTNVYSLAFLNDEYLACGASQSLKIWEFNKNKSQNLDTNSKSETIYSLAVLNDGSLAGGSDNGNIYIWKLI